MANIADIESIDYNTPYEFFDANEFMFGRYYFPHHFRDESPNFHKIILDESCKHNKLAVVAPRGSAKSTILSFLKTIHRICFKRKRHIIIVQNTYKKASSTLEGIKDEIRWNEKINRDFKVELEKDAEGETIFRHKDGFRIRVLCKGMEQIGSVRGEKFGAYRPDLILADDLEDDVMVRSAEQRHSLKTLYDEALIPAGDPKTLDVVVIGTLLHDDSLMADLVSRDKYTDYKKLFFVARYKDKHGTIRSLWEQRWSVNDLNEIERTKPDVFAKEYQGDPSSGDLETIQRNNFRYWRMENGYALLLDENGQVQNKWKLSECRSAVGIDLAWEDKKVSDFSAIVPGLVTPGNDLLICDYICKKGLRPDEFEDIIFDINDRYEALTKKRVQFGFEKAKLEKVMKWFLLEAMRRRGKYLWFKDISWGTRDKVERIMFRVGNRYAQHSIYHKSGMGDLENQLIRLKSAANDDLADALAMLPEMLSFAPERSKEKKPVDRFDFLMKQTPQYKMSQSRNAGFQFGMGRMPDFVKTKEAMPW